jgi:8-oxo-dGTP pyrophosphatase MutT (NUDIX family)
VPTTGSSDYAATHAGGVVYRLEGETPRLLLVTARRDPSIWVLPKGHIERGESAKRAAVREVFEEAGVKARIVEFLMTSQPVVRGEQQRIKYYLMEAVAEETPTEGRQLAWLSKNEAIARVIFAELRAVLMEACEHLAEK